MSLAQGITQKTPRCSLRIGDEVSYAHPPMRGIYRCRIVSIRHGQRRPYVIEVLSHCWSGTQSPFVGKRFAVSKNQVGEEHVDELP